MRTTVRRLGAAVLSTFIAGAVAAGPAHAQSRPEAFLGQATATALDLNVLGNQATLGQSFAEGTIGTELKAVAKAAGQLLVPATESNAQVTSDNTSKQEANKCGPLSTDALKPLLSLATACSSSSSEIKGGVPHASSQGSVATIGVGLDSILSQVPLDQVLQPVQDTVQQVFGQLSQVAPQLNPVTNTLRDLVNSITKTQTLAIKLGQTSSDVITSAKTVNSSALAEAGEIDILPVGGADGSPVAKILIGSAKAAAVYDRTTGKANATFDPALVRIVTSGGLNINVAPGQTFTLLQGTPLESTVAVGAGHTVNNPDGTVTAVADGVALHLLKGINSGIKLNLAHAEAGTKGVLPAVEAPRVVNELPRTGGPGPWLPVAGVTLVAAAFVTRRFLLGAR